MIQFITITQTREQWYLNKVVVNREHIASVEEAREHNRLLSEGKINLGLADGVRFSRVKMALTSGFNEFIVVGSPDTILEKLNRNTKQLLKG